MYATYQKAIQFRKYKAAMVDSKREEVDHRFADRALKYACLGCHQGCSDVTERVGLTFFGTLKLRHSKVEISPKFLTDFTFPNP